MKRPIARPPFGTSPLLGSACVVLVVLSAQPVAAQSARRVTAAGPDLSLGGARALDVLDETAIEDAPGATAELIRSPDEGARLVWRDEWRRFQVGDALFSGLLAGVAVTTYIFTPSGVANWQGGIAADDAVRDGLVLSDAGDRNAVSSLSDGLVLGLAALPALLDALIVAWAGHGSSDVAAQMLMIDFQAHAIAQGLTGLVKWAVRRERPLARGCREDALRVATDPVCENEHQEPASFFSGHTSLAFTSAALVCLHNTELNLLGEAGGVAACGSALALASTVGVLRLMADRHYLSDVAIGATVGLLSGWLLPYALHYMQIGGGENSDVRAAIAPQFSGEGGGLQAIGTF